MGDVERHDDRISKSPENVNQIVDDDKTSNENDKKFFVKHNPKNVSSPSKDVSATFSALKVFGCCLLLIPALCYTNKHLFSSSQH